MDKLKDKVTRFVFALTDVYREEEKRELHTFDKLELAECISYRNRAGNIINADHQAIGNAALAFVGTSGVQLGWLASQADMLAEDWYVVK